MNKKTIAYVEPAAYFTKEAMEIWEKHWAEEEKKAVEERKPNVKKRQDDNL